MGHSFLVVLGVANLPTIGNRIATILTNRMESISLRDNSIQMLLAGILTMLYWAFPIVKDPYGEGFNYAPYLSHMVTDYPSHVHDWLFSLSLKPAAGRQTMLGIYTLLAYFLKIDFATVFRLTDALAGGLFIWVWIRFVCSKIQSNCLTWLLVFTVSLAPFGLAFYGHTDTYSVIYLFMLLWLTLFDNQIHQKNTSTFFLLALFLLILVKLHPLMILLLPSLLIAGILQFFPSTKLARAMQSVNGMFLILGTPIFLAGAVLYLFVFKDYNDQRLLTDVKDFDRLFLPLVSPPPPLDRYNLLSFNHFFDCLNMLLFWSPALMFLTVAGARSLRKSDTEISVASAILLFTLMLYASFLFVINPLIAMPMDWDLFSFPAIILLTLLVNVFSHLNSVEAIRPLVVPVLSLALVCTSTFWVHSNTEPLSYRIESVGKWIYRSYYEHSAKYIHFGIGLIPDNVGLYLSRKEEVINDLKPFSLKGNDVKYASLFTDNGIIKWRMINDVEGALADFEMAETYAPDFGINLQQLLLINEELNRPSEALDYALRLLELQFPSRQEAVRTVINSSLKAERFTECKAYCNLYLDLFGEDHEVVQLLNELNADY